MLDTLTTQDNTLLVDTAKKAAEQAQAKFLAEWTANTGGCLLYTSPSPRDRTRSRMPSSA